MFVVESHSCSLRDVRWSLIVACCVVFVCVVCWLLMCVSCVSLNACCSFIVVCCLTFLFVGRLLSSLFVIGSCVLCVVVVCCVGVICLLVVVL